MSILLLFVVFSCNKNKVFSKRQEIENYVWDKDQPVDFEVDIEDTSSSYQINLLLTHAIFYQFDKLQMVLEMTNTIGETVSLPLVIPVRDKNKEFLGEGLGDIYDLETTILTRFKFPDQGKFLFAIRPDMPGERTMGVMSIGLQIIKEN